VNSAPDSNDLYVFNLTDQLEDNHEPMMHSLTAGFKVAA
jgi:hypothetical protein